VAEWHPGRRVVSAEADLIDERKLEAMKIDLIRILVVLLAVAGLAASPVVAGDTATVVGLWDAVASTPDGQLPAVMTITEDNGALTVEMEIGGASRDVTEETLEGQTLTMTVLYDGAPYDVELAVNGDTMEGTYSGAAASGSLKAKRRP
jgi:hypothetical protein